MRTSQEIRERIAMRKKGMDKDFNNILGFFSSLVSFLGPLKNAVLIGYKKDIKRFVGLPVQQLEFVLEYVEKNEVSDEELLVQLNRVRKQRKEKVLKNAFFDVNPKTNEYFLVEDFPFSSVRGFRLTKSVLRRACKRINDSPSLFTVREGFRMAMDIPLSKTVSDYEWLLGKKN